MTIHARQAQNNSRNYEDVLGLFKVRAELTDCYLENLHEEAPPSQAPFHKHLFGLEIHCGGERGQSFHSEPGKTNFVKLLFKINFSSWFEPSLCMRIVNGEFQRRSRVPTIKDVC